MAEHSEIYRSQAEQYEALVSREDYQSNILIALQKILDLRDKEVVDFGAGTGRLTCLLAPLVKHIHAFDISQHMLSVAISKLQSSELKNWRIDVADHRQVPVADHSADVVISGWSVCYIVVDHPQTWQVEIDRVLCEMHRVLKPQGRICLIETLGTGFENPHPPDHLAPYYAYLEHCGFQHTWIRTDYRFDDQKIAQELTEFFFGESMLEKIVVDDRGFTLSECTGLWWK